MIDLGLSEEQRNIADSASALLREHAPVARLRRGGAEDDLHQRLADWGWFAVALPEPAGGLGLTIAEEALLYLDAGAYLLSPSVLATSLAARLVDPTSQAELIAGRSTAALAIPAEGGDIYCVDRGAASLIVMIDHGELLVYAAAAFAGEAVAGLDESLAIERGRLDGRAALAREPGERMLLLVAAMLAGIARASSALAADYAKTRQQFGQPIGAFQAVKHRCVDMALRAFAAEAQLLMAAASAAEGRDDARFQIRAAVHNALDAARSNGAAAIQVHGGMGFTAECDAHLYLKRGHVLAQAIGGLESAAIALLADAAPVEG
jgi:alkylation response protein AidB-like acyl-CoA dehydrogenase